MVARKMRQSLKSIAFPGWSLGTRGKQFDKVLELNPDDYNSWRQKGVSLSKLGKEQEALAQYDKALALNPDDYHSWRQKGASLTYLGKYQDAVALYDKALELNPDDYNSWREKGQALSHLGKQNEAIDQYDRALALNPHDYKSWHQKGVALAFLDKHKEAIAQYDKALDLNPDDYGSFYGKSVAFYNSGDTARAVEYAKQGLRIKPDDKDLIRLAAFLGGVQKKRPEEPESKGQLTQHTRGVVAAVRESMAGDFQDFLDQMQQMQSRMDGFISGGRRARTDGAWFHILRKWNSYTPILPSDGAERSVGGGYFLQSFGSGIVVDPGFGFIENFHKAGFNLGDIDVIVVTHAHNDHNSDLESLLSLFYNRKNKHGMETALDLYLNLGAFQKFSGLINLRSMNYLRKVHALMPGHAYCLNPGTKLTALNAYHDEVISKDYSVGLWFTLKAEHEERNLIISSDTSLFPPADKKGAVDPDPAKEIWQTYGIGGRKIHLLIPHLGSIKKREFEKGYEEPGEIFYPNHLGILGTAVLISAIKPELAVISEFGEELKNIQPKLIELLEKVVEQTTIGKVKLLPGDTGFIYDLLNKTVCCQYARELIPYQEIEYGCRPDGEFVYYCDGEATRPNVAQANLEQFKELRSQGKLNICHKT
jgi:Flp pilus assembly protein TadD